MLGLHSHNHRRDGADAAAAPQSENPEVNVGRGSVDQGGRRRTGASAPRSARAGGANAVAWPGHTGDPMTRTTSTSFAPPDLAVDHELADISDGFRFLLDLSPVNLPIAQQDFEQTGQPPRFQYRYVSDPRAEERLDRIAEVGSPSALIGGTS